ncbi:MAG: hypothetical protein F6K19_33210 [Cyanothece sp. SIO1E1]|nr:hypothetical protein [Cyanothece sp. SIO1E1]
MSKSLKQEISTSSASNLLTTTAQSEQQLNYASPSANGFAQTPLQPPPHEQLKATQQLAGLWPAALRALW